VNRKQMTNKKYSTVDIFTSEPKTFMTKNYESTEKDVLLRYMKNAGVSAVGGIIFDCCLSDYVAGTENCFHQDNMYRWCDQDTYHIEKYNAAVTEEFLAHVLSQEKTR